MATKLHQILALVGDRKQRAQKVKTEIHHLMKTASAKLVGETKSYTARKEDDEQLPTEFKPVELRVIDGIVRIREAWSNMIDTVAQQDIANTEAKANIMVDGQVLAENIPVSHLVFLEQQFTDLQTFVNELPVLDSTEDWKYDNNKGLYISKESISLRMKKVPKVVVKYEATKEHPAQTEIFHEDIPVGTWRKIKMSGAIPVDEKLKLMDRARKLLEAVKVARCEANSIEVKQVKIADNLLNFVFQG